MPEVTWLRPWALGLLVPWLLGLAWWVRTHHGQGPWHRLVDPALLGAITEPAPRRVLRPLIVLWVLLGVLVSGALAGPSWRTEPVPLFRDLSARVVVLDLSPSMQSIDAAPNRLAVATGVVTDLLRDAGGRQLGLVVFAGDAFTVAPLTRDAATLLHLLHSLDVNTPPRSGSRVDLGLAEAARALEAADIASGDVWLVGDSAGDGRAANAAAALEAAGFPVSVVAVGSTQGGPVRLADGRLAVEDGTVVVTRVDEEAMGRIADEGGGRFFIIETPADITRALADGARTAPVTGESIRTRELPVDGGFWLVLAVLPVFLVLCRRGWLMAVLVVTTIPTDEAMAFDWRSWNDWWARPAQQAARTFETPTAAMDPGLESRLVDQPLWRAVVLARTGRHEDAARTLSDIDTPLAHYNRGNALALAGELEAALTAYDSALALDPGHGDATFNRALVREALAQQREQRSRGEGEEPEPSESERSDATSDSNPEDTAGSPEPETVEDTAEAERDDGPSPEETEARREPVAEEDELAEARASAGISGAELRRLEGLLSQIPDEPGDLLKNRFALELKLRANRHRDTGPRW